MSRKSLIKVVVRQGTTSVVPIKAPKRVGALAPGGFVAPFEHMQRLQNQWGAPPSPLSF
jgi:hypothetical protein